MEYTRNKHLITNVETNEVITHKSINEAKRASRKLQDTGNTVKVIRKES